MQIGANAITQAEDTSVKAAKNPRRRTTDNTAFM
jgi:hypothetical protein